MCFIMDDLSAVFTGDTLLCRGCGRTDFQVEIDVYIHRFGCSVSVV
jgi:glyoxylase-like metal-dependent hydrolase (beta-lactamase superfamily II)